MDDAARVREAHGVAQQGREPGGEQAVQLRVAERAVEAYGLMREYKIGDMPVLDEERRVVGMLSVKDMLAPQAYLRVTSVGVTDPMGYVISVVLVLMSVFCMWLSARAVTDRDYNT